MIFADRVYSVVRRIPKGNVSTYKDVAHAMRTKAYRAVGTALKCNPYAPAVPCHRVISSDGSIGGFMGKTSGRNIETKIRMLRKEGIQIKNNMIVDFKNVKMKF